MSTKIENIICAMFENLCKRASRVKVPRINNKKFVVRVGASLERIEPYFEFIEQYCHENGRTSLVALVVNANGPDVSLPGDWFGKYVSEIEWKSLSISEKQKWYNQQTHRVEQGKRRPIKNGYLWDVHRDWQNADYKQLVKHFRQWLVEHPEWREIAAPDDSRENDGDTNSTEALESFGYATNEPEDDRRETLDSFFDSDAHTGAFGEPESPDRLKNMVENLVDKARAENKKAGGKYRDDLEYLHDEYYKKRFDFAGYFKWPSSNAMPGAGQSIDADMPAEGMLSRMGYHTYKIDTERREILEHIFHAKELPYTDSDAYMASFGDPESPQRLQKVANILATMARNFSKSERDYSNAIDAYKSDLDYLREVYYRDHFSFDTVGGDYFEWPDLSFLPEKLQPPKKKRAPTKRAEPGKNTHKPRVPPATELTGTAEPVQDIESVLESKGTDDNEPGDDDNVIDENIEVENRDDRTEPRPARKEKVTAIVIIIALLAILGFAWLMS